MRTRERRDDRQEDVAESRRSTASSLTDAEALASRLGNQAFGALLQRQAPAATTEPDAGTPAAAPDPVADAKKLLEEAPASDVAYATWLLAAADQGFATLMWQTPGELKALKEGTKIEGVEPSKTELTIPALKTMHELTTGTMTRWTAAPKEPKRPVPFGSLLREGTSLHGGKAIDVSRSMEAGSVAEIIAYLGDLSVATYGIGLPFNANYFDPADELEAKKAAAEAAAPKDGTPAPVTGALQLDTTQIFKVDYDAAGKKWGDPVVEKWDAAYTKIKSKDLLDQFTKMRTAGSKLIIFPDRKGHIHIDRRS